MKVKVNIIKAFSLDGSGGNKAGVVLNADDLSSEQKQLIAQQTRLSETAFVSDSDVADYKLDFFTPTRQIAHCGHATVASFAYLKASGVIGNKTIVTKATIDGIRQINFLGEEVFMEQKAPKFILPNEEERALIFQSLRLEESHQYMPHFVDTGNTFMILQVNNRQTLGSLHPDFGKIKELSLLHDLVGYYIFCTDNEGFDAEARMFAPAYGIEEEAATGMAAGPLAAYLYRIGMRKLSFRILQGNLMAAPSPSSIKVNVIEERGQIQSLFAGGSASLSETIEIEI